MSLTLSLEDLEPLVSPFFKDQWIASSDLDIEECAKPPIGVSLLYFLSPEHPFQGLFSTIEDFMSLSDDITRRFDWIWIEGKTSLMSNVLETLESNGYEVKLWREHPSEGHNFRKAPEQCGALLQKSINEEKKPLSIVNHTKGHIDPIKLNRLFGSDPFTRAEQWHTRDLFEEEQERQVLLESQKPKRHDPLGIFDSEEAPVVVKMSNPFAHSSNDSLLPKAPSSNTSLPSVNKDPLGIFSSGEKPIIVKMNLNLR
jgi:hypothetical protein